MKRIIVIVVACLIMASCKTVNYSNKDYMAIVESINGDLVTVNINGELYEFYGDNYYIGEVITVTIINNEVVNAE